MDFFWFLFACTIFGLLQSCSTDLGPVLAPAESPPIAKPLQNTKPWHLFGAHGINIRPAWEITTGSKDVTIAILDRGFLPKSPAFTQGQCLAPREYFNFLQTKKDTTIHGAWVSSLINTCENNPLSLIGINKNSRLLELEMNLEFEDIDENLYLALWALGEKDICKSLSCIRRDNKYPAQVFNFSFGLELEDWHISKWLFLVILNAINKKGSIAVVAAGNEAKNTDQIFPSSTTGTISVGATTESGMAWPQSNWGESVAIMAPGSQIAVPTLTGVGIANGTSFSAPIISGVISLMRSVYPQLNWKTALYFLQSTAVKMDCHSYCVAGRTLDAEAKCKKDCCIGEKQVCTPGRVDAGRAVAQAKYAAEHGLPLVALIDASDYLVEFSNNQASFKLFNVGGASGKYKLSFPDGGLLLSDNKKTLDIELKAQGKPGDSVEIKIKKTMTFIKEARIRIASPESGVDSGFTDELVLYAR